MKFLSQILTILCVIFYCLFLATSSPAFAKPTEKKVEKKTEKKGAKKPAAAVASSSLKEKPAEKSKSVSQGLGGIASDDALRKAPTIINSKSLEVDSNNRIFYYRQSVVVKQADLTLLCDELEGHYDENNQIERLIGKKNVVITKGDKIKATSQRAVYEAKTQIITLTQNPQLEQNGSILAADVVKVFVAEDRSVAEGDVQVTLVSNPAGTGAAVPSATVTPSSTSLDIPGVSVLGGAQ